jgi:hypothetical protein
VFQLEAMRNGFSRFGLALWQSAELTLPAVR